MQVVYERCAGVDVHQRTVVVTVLLTGPEQVEKHTRTFGTMTVDLLELSAWLEELGVTPVALESTGVYWWPVYNLLEEGVSLLLVNPRHMKAVPGRKTDVKDSEWLADLLRHGLLRASFVPPQPIRALRELTRYRKRLIQERAQQANRLHKVLEAANIKLATVASEVLGTSARAMVEALIAGETNVAVIAVIAAHARRRMRAKIPQLQRALTGRLQPHHRFLLRAILTHSDFLHMAVSHVTQEIEQRLLADEDAVRLLQTIPGIQASAAATIVAEIGVDMARFPSARHLASWAGVCPGNKQSGGKRMAETTTKGSPWLRAMLGEIAWCISHTRGNYLATQYRRLSKRLGPHKAAVAVAHSVLVMIYYMLRNHTPYTDLGADYFDRVDTARLEQHHVRRLEPLGYTVTLTPSSSS